MTLSSLARAALLALAVSALPADVGGQAGDGAGRHTAAYDTAALRVRHGLFRTSVVRGPEDVLVTHIGFGTPPLRELFSGSAGASASFERFARDHARSSWMGLLGGIGFVGGLIAGARGDDRLAATLSIGGTVFSMGSGIFSTRAREHLSKAVWWYNASLVADQGGEPPHSTGYAPPPRQRPAFTRSTRFMNAW